MPYKILVYQDLHLSSLQQKYNKVLSALERGDFKSADVKKMEGTGYFRAKLDREARLLFKFVKHREETFLLLVELLPHHNYEKSRFLRGIEIDEAQLDALTPYGTTAPADAEPIRYLNASRQPLHFLDKFLSFDEEQSDILHQPLPLIIIGSAGSGKTALTLERLKLLKGNLAYFSLSPFLVENAQALYYANHYENERQEIDFLSFRDYLASLKIPEGREVDFRAFETFYTRHRSQTRVKEPYKLFEEFKGVIAGAVTDKAYLSEEEYLDLGVRQSVFTKEHRTEVYGLFKKYLLFLKQEGYYDTNLLSHEYLDKVRQVYDHVIVDEVQDMTNIQLKLILSSLKNPAGFLLCGDANQVVHPNFFSWSGLKSMFYKADLDTDIIHILQTNYRNAGSVTDFANTLLKIKNLRFGSIDKESTHLIRSASEQQGEVEFLEDKAGVKEDLNRKTQRSARYAVLVMNNEDKAGARKFFNTPLVFSIQEAKGLEYENIILVNFISSCEKAFRTIAEGIDPENLEGGLSFSRNRDKENRELDTYKFYINSLYVAVTRAMKNLYIIEQNVKHPLLQLLGLVKVKSVTSLTETQSSNDDWKQEARRLELQGKQEQSEAIRQLIAKQEHKVLLSAEELTRLKRDALDPEHFNNQAKKKLFQYAVSAGDNESIRQLALLKFPEARKHFDKLDREFNAYASDCRTNKINAQNRFIKQYGADFKNRDGLNGLFPALEAGAIGSLKYLTAHGADRMARNTAGLTPIQETIRLHASEIAAAAYYSQNGKPVEPKHSAKAFVGVYEQLKTRNMTVAAEGRQFRINAQSMEYFLLNMMMGMTEHIIRVKTANLLAELKLEDNPWVEEIRKMRLQEIELGLGLDDIMAFIGTIPDAILPEFRRKRAYVNSILAKNEIGKEDPYNRYLFKRTARGIYVVNPELILKGY